MTIVLAQNIVARNVDATTQTGAAIDVICDSSTVGVEFENILNRGRIPIYFASAGHQRYRLCVPEWALHSNCCRRSVR